MAIYRRRMIRTRFAERAASFDDATWRSRVGTFHGCPGAVFLAADERGPIAVVGVGLEDPVTMTGSTRRIWGMWVEPRLEATENRERRSSRASNGQSGWRCHVSLPTSCERMLSRSHCMRALDLCRPDGSVA